MNENLTKDGKCLSRFNCEGFKHIQPWQENLGRCYHNVDGKCLNPIGIEYIQKNGGQKDE